MIDLGIVIAYFAIIFTIGLRARAPAGVGPEEYFLSARSLRWPSIAMSTIATNIGASHFLSVTGAAYVDGLAQGNFELNAIFGIVIAAFFFVPLYLRLRVVTISQFFEQRFGPRVALTYAVLMIVLYALLYWPREEAVHSRFDGFDRNEHARRGRVVSRPVQRREPRRGA